MKHVLITFAVIFYLGFANLIHAQQKFAVIICGDHNASNIPAAEQWNQGMGCGQYGFDEFWNDSFLIWELLHDKMGYSNDNIHVLFANGIDYSSPVQHERYKSVTNHYNIPFIVDQPATKTNVTSLLATLASTVNEEDFLFVWIMSHGGNTNTLGSGDSYIYLSNYLTGENEKLFDYELRDMLNLIPALKKIIFLQAPYSGGFVNKAQNSNTIVMSSSQANESSFRADNIKPGNIPVIENEVLNGVIHHHGEFGYHIYSPLNGMDPSYNTMYGYEEFSSANSNNDDLVSIGEAVSWETGHHSTPCTPLVSDMGNHCPYSNLEYPTLIIEDIVTSKTYSGIVGITGPPSNPPFNSWTSVVIYACTVTFNKAEVVFLDDTRLYNHDGVINIGDNVNLRGNKGSSGLIAYEEINIGENVTFKGCIDSKWGGLAVQNVSVDLSNATFIDCHVIVNTIPELAIRGCTFLRSGLIGQFLYNNTFIGNDSYFINSFAHLFGNGSGNLIVTDSHFSGPVINYNTQYGLSLNHFKNYSIMNNTIQNFGYGVYLYYCSGPRDMRDINNNAI
ncbi:MAG: caspase family protein, partial [Bacteroidales bacterium]|nr:caspase family protein [Bacteroidales bacterium]